jgi:hypothetical protein
MAAAAAFVPEPDLSAGMNRKGAVVMPSPFPGMDPYLEGSTWMNFHGQLCAEIARQLGPKLRPRYVALLTERFIAEIPDGLAITTATLSPDVGVVEHSSWVAGPQQQGIATAPLQLSTVIPEPVLHFSVEIRDRAEHRLVACIEVFSPTNKQGDGYLEYQRKRNRILNSTAHLLEIDLLRQGQRVPMRDPLPEAPYFAFLGRFDTRPVTDVWPIHFDQSLPVLPIPLLPDDRAISLDLQQAFSTVYDVCSYDLIIDYSQPPEVPLPPDAAAWADDRIRTTGLIE